METINRLETAKLSLLTCVSTICSINLEMVTKSLDDFLSKAGFDVDSESSFVIIMEEILGISFKVDSMPLKQKYRTYIRMSFDGVQFSPLPQECPIDNLYISARLAMKRAQGSIPVSDNYSQYIHSYLIGDRDDLLAPRDLREVGLIYSTRHDIILNAIHESLQGSHKEPKFSMIYSLLKVVPDDDYASLTPDLYYPDRNCIIELGISLDPESYEARKLSYYNPVVLDMNAKGVQLNFSVIILPSNAQSLSTKFPDWINVDQDFCKTVLLNALDYLQRVRVDQNVQRLINAYDFDQDYNSRLKFSSDELRGGLSKFNNLFRCSDDLEAFVNRDGKFKDLFEPHLTMADDVILNELTEHVLKNFTSLQDAFTPTTDVEKNWSDHFATMRSKQRPLDNDVNKLKQTFPMPFIRYELWDDDLTSYDRLLRLLKRWKPTSWTGSILNGLLECSGESYQSSASRNMINLTKFLSPEIKREMKVKGPGRKSAIKDGDEEASLESSKYKNFSYSLDCDLSPLMSVMRIMGNSSGDRIQITNHLEDQSVSSSLLCKTAEKCESYLSETNQYMYLKVLEEVSREVALNGLRKRKNGRFVVICSEIKDCIIVIAPGAQLRSEGNPIWFKILYSSEVFHNVLFPGRESFLDHYESSWISLDSDRIDHYMRINDKTTNLMFAMLQTAAKDNKYIQTMKQLVEEGYYSLVGMINAEDKCATSAMMQDIRYFIMKGLSFNRTFDESIKKLDVPIRSPFQIYLTLKLKDWTTKMMKINPVAMFSKRNPRFDEIAQALNDESAGSTSHIPALFSESIRDFHFSLNEMYFCMLFNKDQGNKTHGSLKILLKIAKEERNLELIGKTLGDPNYFMGYKDDDLSHIMGILSKGHLSHQFSARMISIGSKLQRNSIHNSKPESLHFLACNNSGTTKSLDSFATFKASTSSICEKLDEDFTEEDMEEARIKLLNKIGVRGKCVEELLKLSSSQSFPEIHRLDEFCSAYKGDINIMIQIFRKNQIGGTREILILDIASRMMINYVESISRYICEQDDREMLTKGKSKLTKMRDNYLEILAETQCNNLVCENADMTTWAQMFMPFQFIFMFTPFAAEMGDSFNYASYLLACHQNKRIEYPRELILQWLKHDKPHDDASLEFYRQKFINDRVPFMVNESNMGQGILHFTSSYLHLCLISLRDELMSRVIQRFKNFPRFSVKTQVSSDDRLTMRGLPKLSLAKTRAVVMLNSACSRVSDIVFGVKKSPHKTSDGPNLHEFNSAFASSFSTYSPLIKFAINAAPVPDSRSFQRMVNELYATVRQYRENGASSLLTLQAHLLNKRFAESVYHTSAGSINSPESILNMNRCLIPYDLGVYPIYNPSLMELLGPEYYNYRLRGMDDISDSLLASLYSSSGNLIESVATTIFEDEVKKLRSDTIECQMGPIRRLAIARSRSPICKEDLEKWVTGDMMAPFRKTMSKQEVILKSTLRLYTPGAADTFRRTSYSLFYARNSASATASCFKYKGLENLNYVEAVKLSLGPCRSLTAEDMLFYFPNCHTYEVFKGLEFDDKIDWELRPAQMPISVRKLKTTDDYEVLENKFVELFDYIYQGKSSFTDQKISSLNRDWIKIKSILPFMTQSLNGMMKALNLSNDQMIQLMTTISYRFMKAPRNYSKMYIYGRDTNDVMRSMELIFQYNHLPAMRNLTPVTKPFGNISFEVESIWRQLISLISLFLIDKPDGDVMDTIRDILSNTVDLSGVKFMLIKSLNRCATSRRFSMIEKKWIMIIGYILTGYDLTLLGDLMDENSVIKYSWIKSQKRDKDGVYYGDLEVYTSFRGTHMLTTFTNGVYRFQVPKSELTAQKAKVLYQHFCQLNQLLHNESGFGERFLHPTGNFSVLHPAQRRPGEIRFLVPPIKERVFIAHLRESIPALNEAESHEIIYKYDSKSKSIKVGFEKSGRFTIMSNVRLFFPMNTNTANFKIIQDHKISGFSLKWLYENDIITKSYNLPKITATEISMIPKITDMYIDMRPLERLAEMNYITKKRMRTLRNLWDGPRCKEMAIDTGEELNTEYYDEAEVDFYNFLDDEVEDSEDDNEDADAGDHKRKSNFLDDYENLLGETMDNMDLANFDIKLESLEDLFDDSKVDSYIGFLDEFNVSYEKRTLVFNWRSVVSRLNNLSLALQLKVLLNQEKVYDSSELYSMLLYCASKADESDIFMYLCMSISNLICSLGLIHEEFKIRQGYDQMTPDLLARESYLRSLRDDMFYEENDDME